MPKPANGDEFLDLVRKSGLVEGERLAAFMNKIRGAMALAPVTHLQPLAEMLVREGLLSSFQADCLRHGKWQGFSIGEHKVLEKIGSGSMGSVYLCESNRMKCVVAVKVLHTALEARGPVARQRFCREARAGAAVAHVNIAAVYEVGEHDKICYIGMEYVDGSTLQQIVQTSGPLEPLRAARYMSEVATGLVQVHSRGIIHRDIEPNNIIVDRRGNVKIVDFGLARAIDDASLEGPGLTDKQIASLFGTADYLAPEVASGKGASAGADIYSLGATWYFCLTGRPPFGEGTLAQKLAWHQNCRPTPVRSLRPDVPESMAAVLDRMLAKDPAERFASAEAVVQALSPWTRRPVPVPAEDEMPSHGPLVRRLLERQQTRP
jgi:serine/threonine protein kinase